MNLDNKSFRINFSKSETESFQQIVPYICIGIMIATSILFIRFIQKNIIPLSKDIRNEIKLQVYFTPEESAQKIKNTYYLGLPFYESQQIELTQIEYENIGNKEELCLNITPCAFHFLSLHKGNEVIKGFEETL